MPTIPREATSRGKHHPPGFADLNSGIAGSDQNRLHSLSASLRRGGFLVQIQGADRDLVLRAAVRYGRSRRALVSAAAADHPEGPQKLLAVRLAH